MTWVPDHYDAVYHLIAARSKAAFQRYVMFRACDGFSVNHPEDTVAMYFTVWPEDELECCSQCLMLSLRGELETLWPVK